MKRDLGEHPAALAVFRHNCVITECVAANDGRVFKYMGDGVIALFDGTTAADNALRCAVEFLRRVKDIRDSEGAHDRAKRISTRVAITTGDIEDLQYPAGATDIISPVFDEAHAMSKEAEPDELLADESTVIAIHDESVRLRIHPWQYRYLRELHSAVPPGKKVFPVNWMTEYPGLMRHFWRPAADETRDEFVKAVGTAIKQAAAPTQSSKGRDVFGITRTGNFPADIIEALAVAGTRGAVTRLLIHDEQLSTEHYAKLVQVGVRIRKCDAQTIKIAGVEDDSMLLATEVLDEDDRPKEYPWVWIRKHPDAVRLIQAGFMSWWRQAEPLFSEKRVFFFDMDGVLLSTPHYRVMLDTYKGTQSAKREEQVPFSDDDLRCMALQLKGFRRSHLARVNSSLRIRDHMKAFASYLQHRYFRIVVISHGLRDVAEHVAEQLGVPPCDVWANEAEWSSDVMTGGLCIKVPANGKGAIVRQCLEQLELRATSACAIGDSPNDATMLSAVGGIGFWYVHDTIAGGPAGEGVSVRSPAEAVPELCAYYEIEPPEPSELLRLV